MEKKIYQIALSQLKGIGNANTKTLVAYAGSAKNVFISTEKELAHLTGIKISRIKKFKRKEALKRAKQEIEFMQKNEIGMIYYQDSIYPAGLKFCNDSPLVLFTKGNIDFSLKNISIVGTRKLTPYGKKNTHKFVKDLSSRKIQIVSGLAYGIDKEAHECALENSLPTIGVLGHGLDLIYPAAHKSLARRMLKTGGLVTEFLSGTKGDPSNFPQRNRIVAGLSEATVVMESAISGGSLITANQAFGYGRQVFAFPGGIDDIASKGCNDLIKSNKAQLVTCADDMIESLGWKKEEKQETIDLDLFSMPTEDEDRIFTALKIEKKGIHIDHLCEKIKMSKDKLSSHLFNLVMLGALRSHPGQVFSMI